LTLEATDLVPAMELEAFLDGERLGSGPLRATRIGDGASNLTYLLERDGARVVLRRPPPPPLPPSAHDMVREARIQVCLARGGVRVPRILAICEDEDVIGAPFYLMEEVVGAVITDELPPALDTPEERRRLGFELVDGLADLHAVDWRACGLERLGKATGYLERQLRRWSGDPRLGDGHDRRPARRPRLPGGELVGGRRGRPPLAALAGHRTAGLPDARRARSPLRRAHRPRRLGASVV
jgi:aminoglycoside phosphotransferase (APT) family kinase protein